MCVSDLPLLPQVCGELRYQLSQAQLRREEAERGLRETSSKTSRQVELAGQVRRSAAAGDRVNTRKRHRETRQTARHEFRCSKEHVLTCCSVVDGYMLLLDSYCLTAHL